MYTFNNDYYARTSILYVSRYLQKIDIGAWSHFKDT